MPTELSFRSMLLVPTNSNFDLFIYILKIIPPNQKRKASCSATTKMRAPTARIALLHCHWLFLSIVAILLPTSLCLWSVAPSDTLEQGNAINSTQCLLSPKQYFVLEFFTTGNKSYLSISYRGRAVSRVWIGNRDRPILDNSGVLLIDNKGRLVIQHSGGDPILLYSNGSDGRVRATLQDDGNLVLRELNQDGSTRIFLWKSFDYPTDTLLPGMKLGFDNKNGKVLSLTSWVSDMNPSTGPFALHWDPREQELVFRYKGVVVWKSGALQNRTFENIPLRLVHLCTFTISNNSSDGNFFSYFRFGQPYWQLSSMGELNFQLQPTAQDRILEGGLHIFRTCYGQKQDHKGCLGSVQPKCRNALQKFEPKCGDFYGPNDEKINGTLYKNVSVGFADCYAICWNDCLCMSFRSVEDTGCIFWKGQLMFVPSSNFDEVDNCPNVLRSVLNVPLKPMYDRQRIKWKVIVPAVIGSVLIFMVSICLVHLKCTCKGNRAIGKVSVLDGYTDTDKLGEDVRRFSLESIEKATRHFSEENKLGEGGFGTVYKGKLPEGDEIAVKRLSRNSGQGQVEFKNELILIAKLQHTNLVRLIGYCIQGEEKMLIYEYMPNKSLDSFIFDQSKSVLLDWKKRINIIEGIAQGLLYLHRHSRLRIVHRDLKAANILLDADFNPKISDFGMARMFSSNELISNTKRIVGTYGYMAPEYAVRGIYSIKSDVFSFGVLVLEILCGKRNTGFGESLHLIQDVWEMWLKGTWKEKMGSTLKESCSMEQFQRVVHLALCCVENSSHDRPTMSEVISMLANESLPLPLLKKLAFLNFSNERSNSLERNILEYRIVNGLTMSDTHPR